MDQQLGVPIGVGTPRRFTTPKHLYDFGDGWEHTIKTERLVDSKPGLLYPSLIESYRPKLVTSGIGKAAYRGGA